MQSVSGLYAAIRLRYGEGARTAMIAGTTVWALSCLLPNIALYAFGLLTPAFFWLATICPLISSLLATLAGARVYAERPGSSRMHASAPA
jgi:hypothetical protein